MNQNKAVSHVAESDLVIERIFDAPRELVWKTWTDPDLIQRWWGPQYFTAPVCKVDLVVGGKYHFCMRSPEGQDFWSTGEYREIVNPEVIIFTVSFADALGNVVPPSQYGMGEDFPAMLLATVTFEDLGNRKTKLTLRYSGHPAGEMREMTVAGWNTSFDKFAECLK